MSFRFFLRSCFFFFLASHAFPQSPENPSNDSFTVGTTSGYAPYVSLNEKGQYEGFDIDFAKAVAEKIGKKLIIKDLGSMPSLLVALQKNKIDAIIWGMSITESRKKEMDMIYYQGETIAEMPFLFWKAKPSEVRTIEDLGKIPNSMICVESGSYQDSVLRSYPSLKVRFLDKIDDAILEIKYGKSLTAPVDLSLVKRIQSQHPDIHVINLPLPENQRSFGNGICVKKENSKLSSSIQKAVTELRKEGIVSQLEKKWNLSN